jgi:hypothetical protein
MEDKIRNINVIPVVPPVVPVVPVVEVPKYENPQLVQRIAKNGNNAVLDLSNSKYTDQDMEIVANVLKTNKVSYHYSFLPFRLFEHHRSKVFSKYSSSF